MKTLRDIIGVPVLFHWVGWHGKDGPSLTGYDSRDPDVIGDQLTSMQNYGGDGAGVIALTYGPTVSPFIHTAVMEISRQCAERNMPFALCFDPWTVRNKDHNTAMITALNHPDTQTMFGRRGYLPGRPILDFDTGCDPKTILNAVHGIQYLMKDVDYSWPKIPGPTSNAVALPCVALQFNDGTGTDRNKSHNDQSKPYRSLPSNGGALFNSFVSTVPVNTKHVQYVTWNSIEETTDCEAFASTLL